MNRRYCKQCKGTALCDHGKVRRYCVQCDVSSLCVHKKYNKHCMSCSPYPTLSCDYTLCTYQTKHKHAFNTHQQTHTEKFQQRKKIHEHKIQKLLDSNDITYTREHTISYSCIKDTTNKCARIDFLIEHTDTNNTFGLILLEVDENQHKTYEISCELARMSKVMESLTLDGNTIPIKFVRYNPHAFSVNDRTTRTMQIDRHEHLIHTLRTTVFDQQFIVEYLFYDLQLDNQNTLKIFSHIDYDTLFKMFVLPCTYGKQTA